MGRYSGPEWLRQTKTSHGKQNYSPETKTAYRKLKLIQEKVKRTYRKVKLVTGK